jgi:hypothetical protein
MYEGLDVVKVISELSSHKRLARENRGKNLQKLRMVQIAVKALYQGDVELTPSLYLPLSITFLK